MVIYIYIYIYQKRVFFFELCIYQVHKGNLNPWNSKYNHKFVFFLRIEKEKKKKELCLFVKMPLSPEME